MSEITDSAQEILKTISGDLAIIATKNTASFINDKVKQLKGSRDKDAIIRGYEELINGLLDDKSELERIARTYKELYEKVEISDKDLEYLHNTLRKVLLVLSMFNEDSESATKSLAFEPIINLINIDTLRTMQLLGFNYKKAIGEPLTELVSDKIRGISGNNSLRVNGRNGKK